MKVTIDCVPCYLVQCKNALLKAGVEENEQFNIIHRLINHIPSLDINSSPAENSTVILHQMVEMLGGIDPYQEAKLESNRLAESYLPRLETIISEAKDPLYTALKLSVAGNVIDLGIFQDYDLSGAISDVLNTDFARNNYQEFIGLLKKSDSVLIIGDNSGEIAFDKLLCKELKKNLSNVVYAVKSDFVINDATLEDARQVNMDRYAKVITTGNNYLGVNAGKSSEEFMSIMTNADIIISKGQANYETLEGTELAGEKTFFLLKAKCPVVAKNLGVKYGNIVFARNIIEDFNN